MLWDKSKHFSDISPTCYAIVRQKEIFKRHVKNIIGHDKFSKTIEMEKMPNLVSSHSSNLIKRAPGIDLTLQENKAVNIELACKKLNGMIIHPGEVFSFWQTVGKTSKKKGYKDGRVIMGDKLEPGTGGGLCNLGNTINLLVLHSPLDIVEFHNHSDALAPDEGKRVPFSSGTSVCYNSVDYRFKNNTDQDFQLCLWCENEKLYGELRSEKPISLAYQIIEENHRFEKEGNKYYRNSMIYREITDKNTGELINKELILDNHSEVMYDYSLIPKEYIKQ